jgi:hypothetical protein
MRRKVAQRIIRNGQAVKIPRRIVDAGIIVCARDADGLALADRLQQQRQQSLPRQEQLRRTNCSVSVQPVCRLGLATCGELMRIW